MPSKATSALSEVMAWPAELARARRPVVAAAVPGRLELAGRLDEGGDDLGARAAAVTAAVAGSTAATVAGRCGRGQTRPSRVERGDGDRGEGAVDERGEPFVVDSGRRAGRRPAVTVDSQMGAGRVVGDVLVDHRVGEPRQRQPVGVDGRLDLGPAVDADRPLEQSGGDRLRVAHPLTVHASARCRSPAELAAAASQRRSPMLIPAPPL